MLPDAQPSLELIEATRYFRYQVGALPGLTETSPAILGEWWPFLILCLLVYGLVPRVLTLIFTSLRLQRACRHAMLHLPGVQAIFDRLNSQRVETQAEQAEAAMAPPQDGSHSRFAGDLRGQTFEVVDWGGTGLDSEHFRDWLRDCLGALWRDSLWRAEPFRLNMTGRCCRRSPPLTAGRSCFW